MKRLTAALALSAALAGVAHAQSLNRSGGGGGGNGGITVGAAITGTCPNGDFVYANSGVIGCTASTASAGGSNTQVQYNNSGVLGGTSAITTDGTNTTISLGSGNLTVGTGVILSPNGGIEVQGTGSGVTQIYSANTGSSNFTITIPALTDTLVALTATQTLTNKTLTSPTIGTTINGSPTWPSPGAIGGTTPAAGNFTTLGATGNLTTNITGGGTQCVQTSNAGVLSGTGAGCPSGTVTAGTTPTSGFTAGQIVYSNGSVVQATGNNVTNVSVAYNLASMVLGGGGL